MRWTRRSTQASSSTGHDDEVAVPREPTHPLVDIVDDVPELGADERPVLIHALDGFLSAGGAGRLAARHLAGKDGKVVASFDLDQMYDYRARRPTMVYDRDHYSSYDAPRLVVRLLRDTGDRPYLLLSGPEPDFAWEGFAAAVRTVVERFRVKLVVGLASVPMGVPHTRPVIITTHGTRNELVDRPNMWQGQLMVPASAQSLLELRLGQWGHDAMGYVAHVPHYLTQVDYPAAAVALLEAVQERDDLGLELDIEPLRVAAAAALTEIDEQVAEQDGGSLLTGLEEQYDSFSRGAAESLLAAEGPLPTADELGEQVEEFLAGLDGGDERG
jgi:hypothetical protein